MARELFEGFALQAVDAEKGRVAIPSDLRSALERNSDVRTVVIGRHPFDPCLTVHDMSWSQQKLERIDNPGQSPYDAASTNTSQAKRRAFGAVERAPFDASGRFILSSYFRAKAGITNWAFFCGSGETFEIWSPEALLATTDPELEELRDACEFLLAQKKVKL